jgi:VWFA-related protein
MRRPLLSFFLAAIAVAGPLVFAQRIAEKVEVTVIEVPVTVADRTGNAIRGLTAQNFEVLVDGRRMPIEYFETVDLTNVTAGSASEAPLSPAAYRNFLLLFDLANSSPASIVRAQQAAQTFIMSELNERDLAAVATLTDLRGLEMVTAFTRDKGLLNSAVSSLGGSKAFKAIDPLMMAYQRDNIVGTNGAVTAVAEERKQASEEFARDTNARAGVAHDNEARVRVQKQIRNFGGVARALDRLHGQKQIILLSEGFDPKLIVGRQDLASQARQNENQAIEHGEIWNVNSDQRFGSTVGAKDIQEMADLFRRSDVRLHAIDIKGVRSGVDAREGAQGSSNEALFLVTRPTGGTVFRKDNNLASQFHTLLRRQEVIYLLGFRANDGKPGTFHPLRVKLVGAKGEVTHRSGYYDTASNASNLESTLKFSEMMMTGAEVRDVPLTIVATPVPGAEGKARVPIIVDAVGTELLQGVKGNTANANIFIYAFDEKGEVIDFMQQGLAFDVTKTGDALRAHGVRYVGALRLPPGKYNVKALLRVDQTGRIGLTTAKLDVPAYGATAVLPPVSVTDVGQWVTLLSPARGTDATDVLSLGERPFIPGTRANVVRGADSEVALMLRGIPLENLSVTPTLVAADGSSHPAAVQLAGRTAPDAAGLVKLLFRFKPDVAPGNYDLRFDVAHTVVSIPVVVQ